MKLFRDKLQEGVILSTIRADFMAWYGEYETAITFDNQETWRILEGYNNIQDAENGHEKYKNMSVEELKNLEFIG